MLELGSLRLYEFFMRSHTNLMRRQSPSERRIAILLTVALRQLETSAMTVLYIIGAIVAVALAVYLVWALLKPEAFQ
jgi:K+-transporting ATPase KdpF subunit